MWSLHPISNLQYEKKILMMTLVVIQSINLLVNRLETWLSCGPIEKAKVTNSFQSGLYPDKETLYSYNAINDHKGKKSQSIVIKHRPITIGCLEDI